MKKWWLIISALLLLPPSVLAHRLNEYLQAATIRLSQEKVLVNFRLTPGVTVAPAVLKTIDLNADAQISKSEKQRYLAVLTHDISFMLDGHNATLHLVSASFPAVADIKKGVGDLIVEYEANIDQTGSSHQLRLTNRHYQTIAIYLVNCLLPADTSIRVSGQTRSADQSVYQLDFTIGTAVAPVPAQQLLSLDQVNRRAVIKTYLIHGVRHILTGYDHLLFLCALVLCAASLWDLIKIVTVFTIAHSITLTLAVFGLAHLPEQIVEPIIAASIVFVAVKNIRWPNQAGSYTGLAVAFFFGLFHGLGFAGGLLEIMHAMPASLIICAIVGFSLGVEAGNQLVLLPLFGSLQVIKRYGKPKLLPVVQRYASAIVALAGIYYFVVDLWP